MKVRLTARALRDLDDIGAYIAAENPARAESFIIELDERCRSLAHNPDRGQRVGPGASSLRRLRHGAYLIVYAVRPDTVVIERILHSARDLSNLFDEDDD